MPGQASLRSGNEGVGCVWHTNAFCRTVLFEWRAKKPVLAALGKYIAAAGAGYAALLACAFFSRAGQCMRKMYGDRFPRLYPEGRLRLTIYSPFAFSIAGLVIIFSIFIRRNISVRTERNMLALKNETVLEKHAGYGKRICAGQTSSGTRSGIYCRCTVLLKTARNKGAKAYLEDCRSGGCVRPAPIHGKYMVSAILNGEGVKGRREAALQIDAELGVPQGFP